MFKKFSQAVNKRMDSWKDKNIFSTEISGDEVYEAYLKAFPEGTDPIFKTNTEHDCSCCKAFIRQIGNLVVLNGTKVETLWSHSKLPYPYDVVAANLDELVKSSPIKGLFMTVPNWANRGQQISRSTDENGDVVSWNHFYATIPSKAVSHNADTIAGELNTTAAMVLRAVTSISDDAVDQVLNLISEDLLYRGDQYESQVKALKRLKKSYEEFPNNFQWVHVGSPAARIRNTAIGTLLVNLSEGRDLESAVGSYESITAPTNYRRSKALITPRMIEDAVKTLDSLDMRDSIERRFATTEDVSVNDVLWASADAQQFMKDPLTSALMDSGRVKAPTKRGKHKEVGVEEFVREILPTVQNMSVLMENRIQANMVALTAPVHTDIKNIFQWDNNFAWSYAGNVTDSIREKVKGAGGCVDALFRVSLAWHNADDLDIHCYTPYKEHIYYGNKSCVLDVDANGGGITNRVDPVENMAFQTIYDGTYTFKVNNFNKRSSENNGYSLQMEFDGQIYDWDSATSPRDGKTVEVLSVTFKDGKIVDIQSSLGGSQGSLNSKEVWGIHTETLVPVTMVTLSPNHWGDNSSGAKHWFFMLEGCKSDEPVRGIYNEFLTNELYKHRKVFEVLGSKTQCPVVSEQLCGVGFTTARNAEVKVNTDVGNFVIKF